jgi:hypothetical protein
VASSRPDLGPLAGPASGTITGGVVAYNERANLRPAVRSLLDQELPGGVRWGTIWVVASGCTDGTAELATRMAQEDPRVRCVLEPARHGKAHALHEVLQRATGHALILLNSDARAEPGAVGHLLRAAQGKPAPHAVMARPVVPPDERGRWSPTFRWMWELHHEYHAELLERGDGRHLSDELLLVSLPEAPPIPSGIINDGSYLAVWLALHGGGRWYASEARVTIQVPSTVRDHLHQRRRVHVGNAQVTSLLGVRPSTVVPGLLSRPVETFGVVRRMLARPGGPAHLARLAGWELASHALGVWDRVPPRRDHVRWRRIQPAPRGSAEAGPPDPAGGPSATGAGPTERRVGLLLRVAGAFGTGIRMDELRTLLPPGGPDTEGGLRRWIAERPDLGRVEGDRAYAPSLVASPPAPRTARAGSYRQHAERLLHGPLGSLAELVRCVGITGSTAFGEPSPGDDLDLLVITRSGALWWFLARAYLALLTARRRDAAWLDPLPCLNYVVEDRDAPEEFARPGDLLVAREALSVQVLRGDPYYRGLLAAAPWMRSEIPRRYAERTTSPGPIAPEPAPRLARTLSVAVFPFLATYLQLVGLLRNSRFRREGHPERGFRTVTRPRRLAIASLRFEQLRDQYAHGAPRPEVARGRSSSAHAPVVR